MAAIWFPLPSDAPALDDVYPPIWLGFNTDLGMPNECWGLAEDRFVLLSNTYCAVPFVVVYGFTVGAGVFIDPEWRLALLYAFCVWRVNAVCFSSSTMKLFPALLVMVEVS